MNHHSVKMFMALAGRKPADSLQTGDDSTRILGAQLLLSEVLEYVIKGLGVRLEVAGQEISHPEEIKYRIDGKQPDCLEMTDGLADVAYTMYWNALAFGIPLEEAFELVCENNLEKFIELAQWQGHPRPLERQEWHCYCQVQWPVEVVEVSAIKLGEKFYAVGKDKFGKVRKPSHYQPVDLQPLVERKRSR